MTLIMGALKMMWLMRIVRVCKKQAFIKPSKCGNVQQIHWHWWRSISAARQDLFDLAQSGPESVLEFCLWI